MKHYYVLTIFSYDTIFCCFDDLNKLFNYIKYYCDIDDSFYIERKWLSLDMINKLNISYIH